MLAYLRALRDYREGFIAGKKGTSELVAILKKHNMEVTPDTPMLDFPADAAPSFTAVDELVAWHLKMGNIRTKPDLDALTDDRFRKYALAEVSR